MPAMLLPFHLPSCSTFPAFKMKLTFISSNQIVNSTTEQLGERENSTLEFVYFLFFRSPTTFFLQHFPLAFPLPKCCANSRAVSFRNLTAGNALLGDFAAIAGGHFCSANPLNCGRFMCKTNGQIAAGQTRFNEFMPRCDWTSVSHGLSICRRVLQLLPLPLPLPLDNKVKCHFNWRHGSTLSGAADQSSSRPLRPSVRPFPLCPFPSLPAQLAISLRSIKSCRPQLWGQPSRRVEKFCDLNAPSLCLQADPMRSCHALCSVNVSATLKRF